MATSIKRSKEKYLVFKKSKYNIQELGYVKRLPLKTSIEQNF